jgi:hypothetical protein
MVRHLENLEDAMAHGVRDELKKGKSIILEISPQLGIIVNSKYSKDTMR